MSDLVAVSTDTTSCCDLKSNCTDRRNLNLECPHLCSTPICPSELIDKCDSPEIKPPVVELRRSPRFVSTFSVSPARCVTCTPRGELVFAHSHSVSVYSEYGKWRRNLRMPPDVADWNPSFVSVLNSYSYSAPLVVVNYTDADSGGGVYLYNQRGAFLGKVRWDFPLMALRTPAGEFVVIKSNKDGTGWLEKADSQGLPITFNNSENQKKDTFLFLPEDLAMNPVTGDVIVTCESAVTAYRVADLSRRWTYSCPENMARLLEPSKVCVDAAGRILVADSWTRRVTVLSSAGNYLTTINTDETAPSGEEIDGLALTSDNHLAVLISPDNLTSEKSVLCTVEHAPSHSWRFWKKHVFYACFIPGTDPLDGFMLLVICLTVCAVLGILLYEVVNPIKISMGLTDGSRDY